VRNCGVLGRALDRRATSTHCAFFSQMNYFGAARGWANSKAVIVNTNDREELGPEIHDLVTAEGLDAHCLIRLVSHSRPVGLLILARKRQNVFTTEDVDFLTRVSGPIAMAIENALVFKELSGVRDQLQLLLNLTTRITSSLDMREVLRANAANIREVMHADAVTISLYDAATDRFRVLAGQTLNSRPHSGGRAGPPITGAHVCYAHR